MPQLVQIQFECALVAASYGYILGVHMNESTLLNYDVMLCCVDDHALQYEAEWFNLPFPWNRGTMRGLGAGMATN